MWLGSCFRRSPWAGSKKQVTAPGRVLAFATGFWAAQLASAQPAWSQMAKGAEQPLAATSTPDAASGYDPVADEALFLLVSINGRETGMIAEFNLSAQSNQMAARWSELKRIGIDAPRALGRRTDSPRLLAPR